MKQSILARLCITIFLLLLVLGTPALAQSENEPVQVFQAVYIFDDGAEKVLGRVRFGDKASRLVLVETLSEEDQPYLVSVLERYNRKRELFSEPTSNPTATSRYATRSKVITRDDPDFKRVLRERMKAEASVELRLAP